MLLLISPAKKLDFSEESRLTDSFSLPDFIEDSEELVGQLAGMQATELGKLMDISENLSKLNYDRYQSFHTPFSPNNAKQALLSFKGEVYLKFELESYQEEEFEFAQQHLRILSGLYGLLRPLDLIQPYRLEMGTRLKNGRGKNLYDFWGNKITDKINVDLQTQGYNTVVNLASNEYFKSVKAKELNGRLITPLFKEERNGGFKAIFLYAKQARGAMCDFVIKEKIQDPESLKDFQGMGYAFNDSLSNETEWVFTRKS
ncbi:MAG: peroxide stress protein YaaA [Bacteroidia bacterium]|nr:peroxide stress protein YaaA [Bacteroidia bacterium]